MNGLGERIKSIRKENGMIQEQLAQQMTVSRCYISKVENGKETPTDMFIKLFSYVFEVSLEWLKTGNGEKYVDFNKTSV